MSLSIHKCNISRNVLNVEPIDVAVVFGNINISFSASDVISHDYDKAVSYIKELLSINRNVTILYDHDHLEEANNYFQIFNQEIVKSHPRMISTVDMVIFTYLNNELYVGLKKRQTYPYLNKYALAGQFIHLDTDTTTEDTIKRIQDIYMKTTAYYEQVVTVANCNRDLRGPNGWAMSVVYMTLVSTDDVPFLEQHGIEFFPVKSLPDDIAFDHNILIEKAVQRIRNKSAYTNIPMLMMPHKFSMTDLIIAYENIVERQFDQSSFRRKIKERNLLNEIGKGKGKGSPLFMEVKNKNNIVVFDKNIV